MYIISNRMNNQLKLYLMKFEKFLFLGILITTLFSTYQAVSAEEKFVTIPFGAYNPELNTPAENWFSPPTLSVEVGDTVTWVNDDKEAHTITSGTGTGRFGWMSGQKFGEPTGFFDSERFMPDQNWSFTFDKQGTFLYFCKIHPWMEGVVSVEVLIPDYPHDWTGKKVDMPLLLNTADGAIEVNFSWDPKVIKTYEKAQFIFRFYDGVTDIPLSNIKYDFIIIQNGEEIFRSDGVSGAGGDYRNFIFKEAGPVIIKFKNIVASSLTGRSPTFTVDDSSARLVDFTTIVYENTEGKVTDEVVIQPAKRVEFAYEIAVLIIIVPAILLGAIILYSRHKPKTELEIKKSTPI